MARAEPKPRLWVLSRSSALYSTRRLCQAAAEAHCHVRVVDPQLCGLAWGKDAPILRINGVRIRSSHLPHAIIPRVGAMSARAGLPVLRHLELMGCTLANPPQGVAEARDKLRCAQRLLAHALPVPRTAMVHTPGGLHQAVADVGGLPVIVKRLKGTGGVGVMLAATMPEVHAHTTTLWRMGEAVLLQEFIDEAGGADIRALVVGGRLVAAMERRARAGEFRANVHQGGTVAPIRLGRDVRRLAEKAAVAMELGVAGVDLMFSRRGPVIVEVNASPGLRGIEGATGVDVAAAVVRHALQLGGCNATGISPLRAARAR